MPRNKHPIWVKFDCFNAKNSGNWARCKTCKKEMQGIPSRMEKHIESCDITNKAVEDKIKENKSQNTKLQEPLPSTSKGKFDLYQSGFTFTMLIKLYFTRGKVSKVHFLE